MYRRVKFTIEYNSVNHTGILDEVKNTEFVTKAKRITTIRRTVIGTPTTEINNPSRIRGEAIILRMEEITVLKSALNNIDDVINAQVTAEELATFTKYTILTGLITGGLIFVGIFLHNSASIKTWEDLAREFGLSFSLALVGFWIEMGIIRRERMT